MRPDVGKPLQAAQDLIKAGKYKEALAKVRDADAVGNKNANEAYLVERMRIAAASGAGDMEAASKAFEALAAGGKSPPPTRRAWPSRSRGLLPREGLHPCHAVGSTLLQGGRYQPGHPHAADPEPVPGGDYAGARELTAEIQAAEKGGTAPGQDRLNLLLNAAAQLKDTNATVFALERLVTYYPKKEYWVDLLSRMQRKPGFSDRLVLDTYRLSLATGSPSSAADFMEMGQLALQAGNEEEARQVVDKGFAAGVLGSGAEAERHKRLRDLVARKVAEAKANRRQPRPRPRRPRTATAW